MTREELIRELKRAKEFDPERAHKLADQALLTYINDAEITEIFSKITRWYS